MKKLPIPKPPATTTVKPPELTNKELAKYVLETPDPDNDPESDVFAEEDEYTKRAARETQAELDQKALDRNTVKNNDTKHYVTMFEYGAAGDGTTDDSGAFTLAIAAASVGDTIYVPRGTYKLSSSITIASGTAVEFESGGKLSIDSGKVFTVSGKLIAGNYQIFSGSGTVSLADGAVSEIHPAWWGSAVIQSFTADDATPSVAQGMYFKTANANPTTITTLDGGFTGQVVKVIIGDANTTVDFTGTTMKGNGGADWSASADDMMTCIFDGTNWYCDVQGGVTLGSAVSVYMSGNLTLTTKNVLYTLAFDTEDYDTNGEFDTSTYKFTATEAGKYLITCQARFSVVTIADEIQVGIYKNGDQTANAIAFDILTTPTADTTFVRTSVVESLAIGDYILARVINADTDGDVIDADHYFTFMTITRVQ